MDSFGAYIYTLDSPINETDPTGHYTARQIMKIFRTTNWDDVITEFESGPWANQWGVLELMIRAEDGDEFYIESHDQTGHTPIRKGRLSIDDIHGYIQIWLPDTHNPYREQPYNLLHLIDHECNLYSNCGLGLMYNSSGWLNEWWTSVPFPVVGLWGFPPEAIYVPGKPRTRGDWFLTSADQLYPRTIYDIKDVDWAGIGLDAGGLTLNVIPHPAAKFGAAVCSATSFYLSWKEFTQVIMARGSALETANAILDLGISLGGLHPVYGPVFDIVSIAKNFRENTHVYQIP
jgi:hypothetical protein